MESPPDGIEIREASPADADALLSFGRQLLSETPNFVRGPDERASNTAEMRRLCAGFADAPGWCMLHAWAGGRPVGEAVLMAGRTARTSRTAQVGVGVLRSHWRRGIGHALLLRLEERALAERLHRLELTVFPHNRAARKLYEKLGYETEGVKRQSVRIDGEWVDELLMAKLLDGTD